MNDRLPMDHVDVDHECRLSKNWGLFFKTRIAGDKSFITNGGRGLEVEAGMKKVCLV